MDLAENDKSLIFFCFERNGLSCFAFNLRLLLRPPTIPSTHRPMHSLAHLPPQCNTAPPRLQVYHIWASVCKGLYVLYKVPMI